MKLFLILFFLLTAVVDAADLRVQFIGNMGVLITDGKTTLVSDYPYRSGASGYMTYDPAKVRPEGNVVSLITHRHADHFDPLLFEKTGWKIIAPEDALTSIDRNRVIGSGGTMSFHDLRVEAIPTPHANIGHYSYLVTWHGKRLFFTGDTESTDILVATKDLDVAFVSPWLLRSVQKEGKKIDARRIIIYHQAPGEKLPSCEKCDVLEQYKFHTL